MDPGQALREARLKRGLDLYEVHRVTKISVQSLRAMEEDRWEALSAAEAEHELAVYAAFLGLEEEQLHTSPGAESHERRRSGSTLPLIGIAAAVVVIIGVAELLSNGGGGGTQPTTPRLETRTPTTTPSSPVSIEITTHALVWVCLVDQRGHPVINGLNLVRDQTVGPYNGNSFVVAFGNGKVDLTVNGKPVDVPDIAAPFGYRITPDGATRLAPSAEPSCT